MKFQLKALAVAAVLAAALPAQAAIDTALSGNSSLLLTVLDRASNVSATFDLGKNYSDFNVIGLASFPNSGVTAEGTNFSWDLTTGDYGTAWNQFLSLANPANITYAITAADGDTINGVGAKGLISTYVSAGNSLNTNGLVTVTGNFDAYAAANGTSNGGATLFQNHQTVANGSSVANSGAALGSAFYSLGNKAGSVNGPVSMGAIGSDLGVFQIISGGTSFAATSINVFGNGAKFNLGANGALSYLTNAPVVAVPEADTWAMMLLGLGFMGFVARRKQA